MLTKARPKISKNQDGIINDDIKFKFDFSEDVDGLHPKIWKLVAELKENSLVLAIVILVVSPIKILKEILSSKPKPAW